MYPNPFRIVRVPLAAACMLQLLAISPASAGWQSQGTPLSTAAFSSYDDDSHTFVDANGPSVAWTDSRNHTDHHIYVQRLSTSGEVLPGWPADGLPMCLASGIRVHPNAVSDGAGGTYVFWYTSGVGISANYCDISGAIQPGWPADGRLILPINSNFQVTPDAAGGAYMACSGLLYRIDNTGSMHPDWPAGGVSYCSAYCGNAGEQVMVPDGSGGVLLLWIQPAGVRMSHVRSDGILDPAWPSPLPLIAASQAAYLTATSDGAGGAVFAWSDYSVFPNTNLRVHVARVQGSSGSIVFNRRATTSNSGQYYARVVPDLAGGAFAVWEDSRSGSMDVYAQHVDVGGGLAPGWASNGVAVGSGAAEQAEARLARDGSDGIYVAWHDTRSGDYDVYASRILGNGTLASGWPANGLAICSAIHQQVNPSIASNGSGGAYVIWQDFRADSNWAVYGQCIDSMGASCAGIAGAPLPAKQPGVARIVGVTPNPSRGQMRIDYRLASAGELRIEILDSSGRRAALVAGRGAAGMGSVTWSGRSGAGATLPAGVYIARLTAGGVSSTYKFALLH